MQIAPLSLSYPLCVRPVLLAYRCSVSALLASVVCVTVKGEMGVKFVVLLHVIKSKVLASDLSFLPTFCVAYGCRDVMFACQQYA
jgi:hypothetical protein